MTWNDALLKIAAKHNVGFFSGLSTQELEDRIKREIGHARLQKYHLKYKYKGDVGIE